MVLLDCENLTSALKSLAEASATTPGELQAILELYPPERIEVMYDEALDTDPSVDPNDSVAAEIALAAGIDLSGGNFDGAFYFHGTRVLRPTDFLDHGIKPLGAALDGLWADLYAVTDPALSSDDWERLRRSLDIGGAVVGDEHSAFLYRMKASGSMHHGPYGALVRSNAISPPGGDHSYVKNPEIVEDISRALNLKLEAQFAKAATSCVVKFRCDEVGRCRVQAALYYLMSGVHENPPDHNSITYVDFKGAVPAADVESVLELIPEVDGTFSEGRLHRHTS